MQAKTTFHEVYRKQAFDGLIQEVDLEPSKDSNDIELSLAELMEYLHTHIEMFLQKKRGIFFSWWVEVKDKTPLMKDADAGDKDNWFDQDDDEEDEHDDLETR